MVDIFHSRRHRRLHWPMGLDCLLCVHPQMVAHSQDHSGTSQSSLAWPLSLLSMTILMLLHRPRPNTSPWLPSLRHVRRCFWSLHSHLVVLVRNLLIFFPSSLVPDIDYFNKNDKKCKSDHSYSEMMNTSVVK